MRVNHHEPAAQPAKRLKWILLGSMILVFLVAFAARAAYWRMHGEVPVGYLDDDGRNYFYQAGSLSDNWSMFWTSLDWHRWRGWIKSPLYYVFLAASAECLQFDPRVLRMVQVVLNAGTAVLVFLLARRLFGTAAAWAAALFFALYHEFIVIPNEFIAENLFLFLLVAFFLVLARYERVPSPWTAGAAGLVAALATLTRPILLPVLPLVVLWLFWLPPRAPGWWRRRLLHAGALLGGLAVLTVPWMVRNTVLVGRPFGLDNMATLNLMLSHPFPELKPWRLGPESRRANPGMYRRKIYNWPSLRKGLPVPPMRVAERILRPSRLSLLAALNDAQALAQPRLIRPYVNLRRSRRPPLWPVSPAAVVAQDALFVLASMLMLVGFAARVGRRTVLLAMWIVLQMFLLTVVFRPTPNVMNQRYALPYLVVGLLFIGPGISALVRGTSRQRAALAAALLVGWAALVIPPFARWASGEEQWLEKDYIALSADEP